MTLYYPITIPADTLSRIWRDSQRVIVYPNAAHDIQRGDRVQFRCAEERETCTSDLKPLLALVSYVTSVGQPAGQIVVGFESIQHLTDEQLHGLDSVGWLTRAQRPLGREVKLPPHPQQSEIDRLVKLIKENSAAKAPIAMLKRCGDFRRELRAICPDHQALKGWKDDES